MSKLGFYLMIFGVGSILMTFLNMNFAILMWIDAWGETTGMAIRFILAIVGFGLYIYGKDTEGDEVSTQG